MQPAKGDPMRKKRIVLLSNGSVLAAGVERLLQNIDRVEFSTVPGEDPEAVVTIKRLAPTAIVLDSGDALSKASITRLLEGIPKVRVIALRADQKGIEVYRMSRVWETNLEGLLEAISGRRVTPGRIPAEAHDAKLSGSGGGSMKG